MVRDRDSGALIIYAIVMCVLLYFLIGVIAAGFNADICTRAGYDVITIDLLNRQYCITEIVTKVPISEVLPR